MGIRDGVQRGRECKAASGVSGVENEVKVAGQARLRVGVGGGVK